MGRRYLACILKIWALTQKRYEILDSSIELFNTSYLFYAYLIVASSSPAATVCPVFTKTSETVPAILATTLVSIFMASTTART